jgi:glyoxalase family protein
MDMRLAGIHHITAMVDDPQHNVDFYADVLGLRLVKQTVNFDDPSTYHLYFGDELGRPGTILTFFPWPHLRRGTHGSGQISAIALAIPADSLSYWVQRLEQYGIRAGDPAPRLGQQVIPFYDPAGLLLELVAQPDGAERSGWQDGPVPAEHAIRDIAGVTLTLARREPTAALLTDVLGMEHSASEEHRFRYVMGDGRTTVDIVHRPDLPYGQMGAGSVHHVAWRTPDDDQQQVWQRTLRQHGVDVTSVRDRQYFHSIYFREPGGTLFEIATDTPGMTTDETPEQLGTGLKLPPWLETQRAQIERLLPPIVHPAAAGTAGAGTAKEIQR